MNEDSLVHVKNLSFPRLCGSEGEKKARNYILAACASSGIDTELHEFSIYRFPDEYLTKIVAITWIILLTLALICLRTCIAVSLASLAIIGCSMIAMSRWHRLYELLFDVPAGPRTDSANVLARITSREEDPTIIFMAHYDSKSQMLPIPLRILLLLCGPLGTVALAGLIVAALILRLEILFTLACAAGAVVIMAMAVLMFNRSVDESPGAMDNATGVAVLLELARAFRESPPPGVNLCFLFTGAEEIGLAGAVRFVQKRAQDFPRRNTSIVNLDGVGGMEKLLVVDRYGLFPPAVTSAKLGKRIRTLAASRGLALHRIPLITGALWDHVVWAAHGYESLTLSMGGWEKATLQIHSALDSWEHINPRGLTATWELCRDIVLAPAEDSSQGR